MEFTAKTVEEAIKEGLLELNITEEEAEIVVKEQPTKGIFGKLKGKAVVEITKKPSGIEKALDFVKEIFNKMDINAKASLSEDGENPEIFVVAENSSEIIGYRGEVLDAIQTLAGAVANIGNKVYKKVVVNCENYREKREETLVNLAHKLEAKATDMRREVILEPMSPFERRIIHTALAESETVKTRSEGKEPSRYVVIVPNDLEEGSKPYNAGRKNNDQKNHFDKRNGGYKKGSFNKDRRNNGYKKDNRRSGGEVKKKSTITFGTYLGNSLKDNKED